MLVEYDCILFFFCYILFFLTPLLVMISYIHLIVSELFLEGWTPTMMIDKHVFQFVFSEISHRKKTERTIVKVIYN